MKRGGATNRSHRAVWEGTLTGGSLPVVPGVYVPFALAPFRPRHFLHAVNLRDTQFGIECKVHFPSFDGQVAVVPVPQLLQVLVVKDVEGVVPGSREISIRPLSFASSHPAQDSSPRGSRKHRLCRSDMEFLTVSKKEESLLTIATI